MRALVDSDVVIAMLERGHVHHERARVWFERAAKDRTEVVVAAHSLLQVFRILTSLPVRPRIDAASAVLMLRREIVPRCSIRAATCRDHARILSRLSRRSMAGGVVYDGLIAEIGRAARVDKIVTFNASDFRRVAPDLDVIAP